MILGGFAAPLFLFLAGLAVPFAGRSSLRKSGSRRTAAATVISRGLVVFILAFAFRLQTFIVTPGNSVLSIFRVDILNVMGPSLAVSAAVWAVFSVPAAYAGAMALAATAVALTTPVVRAAGWVDAIPVWFQWYLRPAGEFTTFTLFPWAGFVFAGAALGAVLADAAQTQQRRLMGICGATGVVLVAAGLYAATLPPLFASSSFWTTSPTYFTVRVGVMMSVLFLLFAADSVLTREGRLDPLQRLGQNSLFVYWIHVELVYGYASWLLRRQLPLAVTCVAYLAFVGLMYGAVVVRDRVVLTTPWTRFRQAPSGAVMAS